MITEHDLVPGNILVDLVESLSFRHREQKVPRLFLILSVEPHGWETWLIDFLDVENKQKITFWMNAWQFKNYDCIEGSEEKE